MIDIEGLFFEDIKIFLFLSQPDFTIGIPKDDLFICDSAYKYSNPWAELAFERSDPDIELWHCKYNTCAVPSSNNACLPCEGNKNGTSDDTDQDGICDADDDNSN